MINPCLLDDPFLSFTSARGISINFAHSSPFDMDWKPGPNSFKNFVCLCLPSILSEPFAPSRKVSHNLIN